mgnify:CR=1 FL=1
MRARHSVLAIFLLAVLFVPYMWSGVQGGFVWDDDETIVKNRFIEHWGNARLLFSLRYFQAFTEATYRPVVTFSYFVDAFLWGKEPAGYHATQFVVHFLVACLVYALGCRMGVSPTGAWIGAAAFAVLPVNAEAVACVSLREDLLSALFVLGGLYLYICARDRWRWVLALGAAACYALALFSKENALVLPIMLVLWELLFAGQGRPVVRQAGRRLFPMLVVLVFYCIVRFGLMTYPSGPPKPWGLGSALVSVPRVWMGYLVRVFFPLHLRLEYGVEPVRSVFSAAFVVPVAALGVVGSMLAVMRRRRPDVCFFGLWFFVFLLPVSNVVPLWNETANRYVYLPAAGLCALLALGVSALERRATFGWARTACVPLGVCLVMFLVLSIHYNDQWRDARALWAYQVRFYPRTHQVRRNLGLGYQELAAVTRQGVMFDKAEKQFRLALALEPAEAAIHRNLAYLYVLRGDLWGANEHYSLYVRRTFPAVIDREAVGDLGTTFVQLGALQLASRVFEVLVERASGYADGYVKLAALRLREGRLADAARLSQEALDRDRYHVGALLVFSQAMEQSGRHEVALDTLRYALGVVPKSAEVSMHLARVLNRLEKYDEAREVAAAALVQQVLEPTMRAWLLLETARATGALAAGQNDAALAARSAETVREAVGLAPDDIEVQMNAGLILADMGRYEEAVGLFQRVLANGPGVFMARFMIGRSLEALGDVKGALSAYEGSLEVAPDPRTRQGVEQAIENLKGSSRSGLGVGPGAGGPPAH